MAGTGSPLTAEEITRIRELWRERNSINTIVQMTGCSTFSVRKYCKGIEQYPARKLTVIKRTQLLRNWR